MPLKLVVLFGKWDDKDDKKLHIFITNKLNDSSKSVIQNYLMRWGIEQCFKELKDTFYFDQYQVRSVTLKRLKGIGTFAFLTGPLLAG